MVGSNVVSRDPQDSETILQAWFGSPLKTIITVGGLLGFAFIGYSTLGETNRSGSDADKIRDATTQSSTRAAVDTGQPSPKTTLPPAASVSLSSLFGYWRLEEKPNGCAEQVTHYTDESYGFYIYHGGMRQLDLKPFVVEAPAEYRVDGDVIFVRARLSERDRYEAIRVIDADTIELLELLDAGGTSIDLDAVLLDNRPLPRFDSVRAGTSTDRRKRCHEEAAAAFLTSVRSIADRAAQLRASRPDEPIRCGVTVDCRSRQSVLRELARVGSLLRSRGNPFWENCASSMTDIKGFDHQVWEMYAGTERDAASFLDGFLASCNAGL